MPGQPVSRGVRCWCSVPSRSLRSSSLHSSANRLGRNRPTGILRNGDCVQILDNGDAREIACTGIEDMIVRAFNPTFDASCPGRTVPHRDRLGMGVACIELPDLASQG